MSETASFVHHLEKLTTTMKDSPTQNSDIKRKSDSVKNENTVIFHKVH